MSAIIFLVFIAIFIFLLFGLFRIAEGRGSTGQYSSARQRRRAGRSRRSAPRRASSRRASSRRANARRNRLATQQPEIVPQTKKAALQAMRRAMYDVGEEYVRITDIGLLEYCEAKRPRLLRDEQARTNSDYLRPFAELWLPYRSRGMVRFELVEMVNGRPHLHYADEDEYDLNAGINALLPGTWLPIHDKDIDFSDQWHLRVLVGETILADHTFGWRESIGGGEIQRYIASDGEISATLQQAISAQQGEAISLDDLLGD